MGEATVGPFALVRKPFGLYKLYSTLFFRWYCARTGTASHAMSYNLAKELPDVEKVVNLTMLAYVYDHACAGVTTASTAKNVMPKAAKQLHGFMDLAPSPLADDDDGPHRTPPPGGGVKSCESACPATAGHPPPSLLGPGGSVWPIHRLSWPESPRPL